MTDRERRGKSFWAGLEQRFRPFGSIAVLEDARVASRMPLLAGLGAGINILAISVFLFSAGEPATGWVSLATGIVYLGATGYYVVSGHAKVVVEIVLWVSFVTNVLTHVLLGGFAWSGVALGWGILISVAAALFLSRTETIVIALSYVATAMVLAFLEPTLRAARTQPAAEVSTVLALDMFVVSLSIAVPITALLVQQISREQARANSLLLNVLPEVIAQRLKASPGVIADEFDECTVLFADIVGFTEYSTQIGPERLVTELNHVFTRFDGLVSRHGAEKIKTIGDGYMAVAGVPLPSVAHVSLMCDLALDMKSELVSINNDLGSSFELRIGLNTGGVVAGVIGTSRFSYDLWGDTVNVASRMESHGAPGRIQVTGAVVEEADDHFEFRKLGAIPVKGRGQMEVHELVGRRTP